jgi:exodeoxyribonuclease VII small subunit
MKKEMSFEASLKRLEEIVIKLESGELPLDESLKLYEEGAALSIICSKKLDEAEQRIVKISVGSANEGAEAEI